MKKIRSRLPFVVLAGIIIFHTTGIKPAVYGEFGPGDGVHANYEDYTQANFEEAIAAENDVVVYVGANRCPTCTRFEDNLLSTVNQIPKDLTILAADLDRDTGFLATHGVRYQSTTLYFDSDAKLLTKRVGRDHNLASIVQTRSELTK